MSSLAEKEAVRGILAGFGSNPVIVELGAHVGEESQWIIPLCNHPRYIAIEPDGTNYVFLRNLLPVGSIAIRGAVASFNGHCDFHESENLESKNRASGSIRNPTGHLKHFPEVTFSKTTVPCRTLDFYAEWEHIDHIDLLWCDIQGAERDMIEGGRATLAKTRYMMIEAEPEVELYEGQALKPELIAMLPDWVVLKDFGYNLLMWNSKYA